MKVGKSIAICTTSTLAAISLICLPGLAHQLNKASKGQAAQASVPLDVPQWFNRYDQIRREAQMTAEERDQANELLSKGFSPLRPENEKVATKNLLTKLVGKYRSARLAMKNLPTLPQTQKLHNGYSQYFSTAGDLFADYLTVQSNLFAKDKQTGRPILGQLLERKDKLQQLNEQIQDIDKQTRKQFDIPGYQYKPKKT